MDDRRLELRVALLAVVSLACGGLLLYLVGAFSGSGDQLLLIDFAHSGGVPAGSPVKLAGVAVGRVRSVDLLPARRDASGKALPIRIEAGVRADVFAALHHDLRAGVAMQGALGEPFLELSTGSAEAPPLRPGEVVRGVDPPRLDLLLAQLDDLVSGAHALLGGNDREQVTELMQGANHLARSADQFLVENKDALTSVLKEISGAATDARQVISQAKGILATGKIQGTLDDARALASTLREDVPPLTHDARKLTQSATNLAGNFVPADGVDLKSAIARYEAASTHLESIATRADGLVTRIEAGEGTVGGMVKDPQVYQDLKALVSDLREHPWKVLWK
jgi:phospholipid/cholesterol/gamma-HCH transport system substrate-binding protein